MAREFSPTTVVPPILSWWAGFTSFGVPRCNIFVVSDRHSGPAFLLGLNLFRDLRGLVPISSPQSVCAPSSFHAILPELFCLGATETPFPFRVSTSVVGRRVPVRGSSGAGKWQVDRFPRLWTRRHFLGRPAVMAFFEGLIFCVVAVMLRNPRNPSPRIFFFFLESGAFFSWKRLEKLFLRDFRWYVPQFSSEALVSKGRLRLLLRVILPTARSNYQRLVPPRADRVPLSSPRPATFSLFRLCGSTFVFRPTALVAPGRHRPWNPSFPFLLPPPRSKAPRFPSPASPGNA